jgi:hypothetical protein
MTSLPSFDATFHPLSVLHEIAFRVSAFVPLSGSLVVS